MEAQETLAQIIRWGGVILLPLSIILSASRRYSYDASSQFWAVMVVIAIVAIYVGDRMWQNVRAERDED